MHKLLIAASGTGGHIFPAEAVANRIQSACSIIWMGVPDRMETKLIADKFRLFTLRVSGLQGKGFRKLFQLINLIYSTFNVISFIRKEKIQTVFTTGGYIAAPAILAAKICRIKVILHESNAYPGKVTRVFGRFCNKVALGIPDAQQYLPNCECVFTGTPVRDDFLLNQNFPSWIPKGQGPLILVIGGSQGAKGLNCIVNNVLPFLLNNGCRVVHLTGKDYKSHLVHQNLVQKSFIENIPSILQNADLAISRAGASTLSELAVTGTPAILIPYPFATDKHQDLNAAYACKNGAALIIKEDINASDQLIFSLNRILKFKMKGLDIDNDLLVQMKTAMEDLAVINSRDNVANMILNLSK